MKAFGHGKVPFIFSLSLVHTKALDVVEIGIFDLFFSLEDADDPKVVTDDGLPLPCTPDEADDLVLKVDSCDDRVFSFSLMKAVALKVNGASLGILEAPFSLEVFNPLKIYTDGLVVSELSFKQFDTSS